MYGVNFNRAKLLFQGYRKNVKPKPALLTDARRASILKGVDAIRKTKEERKSKIDWVRM